MKLNFEQIKSISCGAVRAEEENGCVKLYRFTKEQEEIYKNSNEGFYQKTFAPSGAKLMFKTDSKSLFLKVKTEESTTRTFFSFDVFANGNLIGYLDNFSDAPLPENYVQAEFRLGVFSKTFLLGEGEKTVNVYLPWSVKVSIEEISVDDGAFVQAVKPQKKMLVFGDSITQGYDALRPSNRYGAKLADALGAEEINKAIGGEVFFPPLAESKDDISPDYITVAYGTNDWSNKDEESFKIRCRAFYTALCKNYPGAKIFAVTPIWRKDNGEERCFGEFSRVEKDIKKAVEDLSEVTVICGYDFVPHDEKYFSDLRLHPNDDGFGYYFNNIYTKIKEKI